MHFTGPDAIGIESAVVTILKNFLAAQLASEPHKTTFSRWLPPGRAILVTDDDNYVLEVPNQTGLKQPHIVLNIPEGNHERYLWRTKVGGQPARGERHEIDIVAEIVIPDNVTGALKKLRDAVGYIVAQGEAALYELGLEEATIIPDNPSRRDRDAVNPLMIRVVAYTL